MAEIGDICDIVPPNFPVAGLFKLSHVKFFGDSREISPQVFGIFPKFSVCFNFSKIMSLRSIHTLKNGSETKNCAFGDIVPSNYPVACLFKYGHVKFGMKLLLPRYYLNVSVTRPCFLQ